jgi:hypothetical protein
LPPTGIERGFLGHPVRSLVAILTEFKRRSVIGYWTRWAGYVENTRKCKMMVITPQGKVSLRRTKHKWEDIIKMNVTDFECDVD